MTKKNNVIWYDWNSPSGFELLETENQLWNKQMESKKKTEIIELKRLETAVCACGCQCSLKVAL